MNKIKITSIILILITTFSCQKNIDEVKVTYQITGLFDKYELAYFDEEENTIMTTIHPKSATEMWTYEYHAEPGHILYLYLESEEIIDNSADFKFRILLNDKVFKEAFDYDKETLENGVIKYTLKRNGTIPFDY